VTGSHPHTQNWQDVTAIKTLIVACVASSLTAQGIALDSVSDDLDLRGDGVIDSLGFLQLITAMESRLNRRIDLADLDPALLTNLGALAAHIASRSQVRMRDRAHA
jgi:acyl carrier protein